MNFVRHALTADTPEERTLLNAIDAYTDAMQTTYTRTSRWSAITDNTNTVTSNYGRWIQQVHTILEQHLLDTEHTAYVDISVKTMNAYPNDRYWCDRHSPISEALRPRTVNNKVAHTIRINALTRGMDYFNVLDETCETMRTCKPMESVLTLDRYQKVRILQVDTNKLVIYTNRISEDFIHKVVQLRYAMFPELNFIMSENFPAHDFIKAVFDENAEAIKPALQAFADNYEELRNATMWTRLKELMSSSRRNAIAESRRVISRLDSDLTMYESNYRRTLESMNIEQTKLLGLLNAEDTSIEPLKEALKRFKNLHVEAITDHAQLLVEIETIIQNYRQNDVEFWYKNPHSRNDVTRHEHAAQIIRALFIDCADRYKLHTNTKIAIPITGNDSWSGATQSHMMTNPHIRFYNCYRSSQLAANKALMTQEFDKAFAILTAACGTITFTDAAVVSRFANLLEDMYCSANTEKCVEDTESGEFLTIREFLDKINAEKESNESEATEA